MNQRIHALEKMLETSRRNDTHAGLTDEPSIQEEVDSDAIILANHCLPLEANDIAVDLSDGPVVHDPSPQERVNDRRSWEEVDLPDLVEMNMDYAQSCSSSSRYTLPIMLCLEMDVHIEALELATKPHPANLSPNLFNKAALVLSTW